VAGDARPASAPLRIGVLNDAFAANHPAVEGLKAGLRELGLEEGRDVAYEIRFTRGDLAGTREYAAAIVNAKVDVIFTSSEAATRSAMASTTTIPIVFTLVRDPVGSKFVGSLAKPGGNATGISSLTGKLAGKRLEFLKALAPKARRVWAIFDIADEVAAAAVAHAQGEIAKLDLQVVSRPVGNPDELAHAIAEIRPGDALLVPDGGRFDIVSALLDVSIAARVPAVFPASLYVGYGGLVSYGSDYYAEGFQAARLVEKILNGAPPGSLPVEAAERIDLAINLETARRLGLSVPRKILLRADTIRR
jgi:putative ABC transport system substrate-binding protein